ncbi:hypothetical protein BDA99DRAFT_440617, partial [Phascolomyces articulosus]
REEKEQEKQLPSTLILAFNQCLTCEKHLVRPHTLSCGYTVCQHCCRSDEDDHSTRKPCVAPNCQRIHTTPTQTNVIIDQIQHVLQSLCNDQQPTNTTATKDMLQTQLVSLLECPICCSCLYQPSTTPCGHTFCQPCLTRSLDHMPSCPICRQPISWTPPPTELLCQLVQSLFSQHIKDQLQEDRSNEEGNDSRVPILVGSLAFPHVRCVIHIFEPRYRLMLRRVMESRRHRFAMCLSLRRREQPTTIPFHEYGTMLELTHVQTLEDGRSIVQAVGSHRFRVLNHSMVDGYHVGKLERIDDIDGEQEQTLEREQIMRASAQRIQQQQQAAGGGDGIHPRPSGHHATTLTTPAYQNNRSSTQFQLGPNNFDRSLSPQQQRPRPGMLGGRIQPSSSPQRRSWAAQAHPQTQMARSPWLQMHLRGLSPAQTKPSPYEEICTDDLIQQLGSFITLLRNTSESSSSSSSSSSIVNDRERSSMVNRMSQSNTNHHSMNQLNQILHAFGQPPPTQGPRRNQIIFTWWVANMMPLNQEEKAKLLAMRMLRERVLTIIQWMDRFKDQWSFWLSQPNNNNSSSSSPSSCHIS